MASGIGDRARDFVRNWRRYDAPLLRKLGLTVSNRAKWSTWTRPECCGHPGEPGC